MLILGLESSCDETAAALVTGDRQVLAHRLAGQEAAHRPYGGVVPEIAARAHVEALEPLIAAALADAGVTLADVDAIAATAGPGLIGGVMVGLVTGKALAHAAGKPLVAVNHLEGHALSPRLSDPDLEFPYLLLLVSGGHCQLLLVEGVGACRRLATTIDDAAGEAFDKTAKLLGLGFPGGPAVERAALAGDPKAVPLPRPLLRSPEPHFSFAGLKAAVARVVGEYSPEDIAASFQAAVVDCLIDRTTKALRASSPFFPSNVEGHARGDGASTSLGTNGGGATAAPDSPSSGSGPTPSPFVPSNVEGHVPGDGASTSLGMNGRERKPTALVVAGGVAANSAVRTALAQLAADHGLRFVAPPLWLCTDNAAMIAWAGAERFAAGLTDPLDVAARPRWPLDPTAEAVRGAGVKA